MDGQIGEQERTKSRHCSVEIAAVGSSPQHGRTGAGGELGLVPWGLGHHGVQGGGQGGLWLDMGLGEGKAGCGVRAEEEGRVKKGLEVEEGWVAPWFGWMRGWAGS